jgi:DNA-binding winged helix-turn-helix (wHTH) protein/TolB-like protein/Tfp pilus assembly protein PilF
MENESSSTNYAFDGFLVDTEKRLLLGRTGAIALTPKVFDTLQYLVSHAGHVIEKDELMSAIWHDTIVEENNLNKNISTLRRVLGENRGEHRFIATVPGRGYKFVAKVDEVRDGPAEASVSTRVPSQVGMRSRYWFLGMAATVLVGLVLVLLYSGSSDVNTAQINSVAVLPFYNPGGDPELDYLSEGLSEALIDRLSELPQLKVIARNSSFQYRDESLDLQDVARKLGVQAIITGRLIRRGEELSVRVELVDTVDNKQIWGQQFSRKLSDALSIGAEVATAVSDKMRVRLSGQQENQLARRGTDNPQALDHVLKGDFLSRKTATRFKALENYVEAVALDPNFALAQARLANIYQTLAGSGEVDPQEALPKIKAAAQRAMELDPTLADSHLVLAELARDSWDWQTAEREYKRALELNPNFVRVHVRYCSYLSVVGRHEDAISEAKKVRELDPQNVLSHLLLPNSLLIARRFDESIVEMKRAIELEPIFGAYISLGSAYAAKGMYTEAIAAFSEATRLGGKGAYLQICLGAAYARAGENKKALAILRDLESGKEYVAPGELAILHEALGDRDRAIKTLEKGFAAHDLQLQHLSADSGFDSMHDDPRFQDLLSRIGLNVSRGKSN